jgi:hypothetical protein
MAVATVARFPGIVAAMTHGHVLSCMCMLRIHLEWMEQNMSHGIHPGVT